VAVRKNYSAYLTQSPHGLRGASAPIVILKNFLKSPIKLASEIFYFTKANKEKKQGGREGPIRPILLGVRLIGGADNRTEQDRRGSKGLMGRERRRIYE
jgi:hypothetical protein